MTQLTSSQLPALGPQETLGLSALTVSVIGRELHLALRRWDQVVQPILFFVVVTILFPLATSPDIAELRRIAAGVVWVAAMLASLLALESLFRPDVEDGTMEQWVLSGQPLAWLLLAKTLGHWILTGLPLVVIAPLLTVGFGVDLATWPILMGALLLGTGILAILGAIGAALTVSVRRGNVLVALLVLPLQVPVLIFGAHAVDMATRGEAVTGPMYLLSAMLLLALSLGPFAMAAAIRISVES